MDRSGSDHTAAADAEIAREIARRESVWIDRIADAATE
jgi:hypothetical protein